MNGLNSVGKQSTHVFKYLWDQASSHKMKIPWFQICVSYICNSCALLVFDVYYDSVICVLDFQQIELRVLAHLTKDTALKDLFHGHNQSADVFIELTALWYHTSLPLFSSEKHDCTFFFVKVLFVGVCFTQTQPLSLPPAPPKKTHKKLKTCVHSAHKPCCVKPPFWKYAHWCGAGCFTSLVQSKGELECTCELPVHLHFEEAIEGSYNFKFRTELVACLQKILQDQMDTCWCQY